ncbi:MAG: SDR family oxidoreductase [candidate division Zixibacteria bacterium]|nr:SDR family oxidoreductase [candidate division Zixibacteria bacterium]
MQKVLVAGATGYLGRFVVQEFNRRGYWVRALARSPRKLEETGPFQEPAIIDQVSEVFTGQVTEPETLQGLCDDIDIVFSSVGITRQKDKLTYRDVDYQGNRNILDIALTKPVKKFIYVSVFNAHMFKNLAILKAHEDFVRDLQDCGLDYAIIRPTGYFSDMTEFLTMAKSGQVYLIGNGENKINPVHGADLAKVCVDAVTDKEHEIPVGGPVTYRMGEIAGLAFSALGKKPKVTRIPLWVAKLAVRLIRPFNKQLSDLADFFLVAGKGDGVAPATGRHTLDSYYRELASRGIQR